MLMEGLKSHPLGTMQIGLRLSENPSPRTNKQKLHNPTDPRQQIIVEAKKHRKLFSLKNLNLPERVSSMRRIHII